jgi:hypothetical protein
VKGSKRRRRLTVGAAEVPRGIRPLRNLLEPRDARVSGCLSPGDDEVPLKLNKFCRPPVDMRREGGTQLLHDRLLRGVRRLLSGVTELQQPVDYRGERVRRTNRARQTDILNDIFGRSFIANGGVRHHFLRRSLFFTLPIATLKTTEFTQGADFVRSFFLCFVFKSTNNKQTTLLSFQTPEMPPFHR